MRVPAPSSFVLRRKHSPSTARNVALEKILVQSFSQAISKLRLRPVGQGCGHKYYKCPGHLGRKGVQKHEIRTRTQTILYAGGSTGACLDSDGKPLEYRKCMHWIRDHDESRAWNLETSHSDSDEEANAGGTDVMHACNIHPASDSGSHTSYTCNISPCSGLYLVGLR